MAANVPEPALSPILAKARAIALHIGRRAPRSAACELDDLVASAFLGVAAALARHRGDRGATFESFAMDHARGAVYDELRKLDRLSRDDRRQARRILATKTALEERFGRTAEDAEVATELDMDIAGYRRVRERMAYCAVPLEPATAQPRVTELHLASTADSIEDELDTRRRVRRLSLALNAALDTLPARDAEMIRATYFREQRAVDVGRALGLTQGRVSQIRKAALVHLRTVCANDVSLEEEVG